MQRQDMKIILKESDNERSLSRDDLPIRIGSDLDTDIKISGSLSLGVAMIIDLIDGRYVLQKINPTLEAMINRDPLTGNHWISDGDQLEVSDKLISFNLSSELLEVNVSNISMEDQPTQFQKRQSESIFQNKLFQRSGVVFFLALTYFLFYLFTSKAVEIRTTPGDVNISVSGGVFPHLKISDRFLLRPGEYQARYSKSGYFTGTLVIQINEESSQVIDINLKKLPGVIQFKTQPDVDYELFVNEERVKSDTEGGYLIEAGKQNIELRFEKYFSIQKQLIIEGMNQEQQFIFDLEPAWADVQINTDPSEAEVVLDGQSKGFSPLDLDIIDGDHTLLIRKSGYKDLTSKLSVQAGEEIIKEPFKLDRLDSKLQIISAPEGASVNLNSVYLGMTPIDLELEPLVTHLISFSKPGFQTQDRSIQLDTVETLKSMGKDSELVKVDLQPIYGNVNIQGTKDALVMINNETIGLIPLKVNLIAKEQTLTVKKDGLVTQEIKVKPTPGFDQTFNIRLLTEEEAVLAAMPQSLKTSQGLVMRLISPGRFIMGTPRRSQGRQANESERLIEITKPFYVGTREVINNEFRAFNPKHTSGAESYRELSNGFHPTVMVTWEEAAKFCNWLSEKESLSPAYSLVDGKLKLITPIANGYRLLTEAEWEWVARYNGGGGKQKYPWGESMPPEENSGNYADESAESLMTNVLSDYWDGYPVSSPSNKFKPNSIGIYDLGGNVSEWVNDYYSTMNRQVNQLDKDPVGPGDGSMRVIRGSSWRHSTITALRFAYRDYGTQGRLDVGFRIARYTENE